ncbi:hypothetical protein BDF19DRAFT_381410 [Syncephalis fuscata]|nr:hypothetical protein BDF19DRAFT_381410 [Syncephalis fuscata]
MSRGATGTNNIPLGYNRLARGGQSESSPPPPPPPPSGSSYGNSSGHHEGYMARVHANHSSDRSRDRYSHRDYEGGHSSSRYGSSSSGRESAAMEGGKRSMPSDMTGGSDNDRGRKRKSRWADPEEKSSVPGMPTALSGAVPKEKLDLFLTYVRLEEIGRKLNAGDYVPRDRRSPSPEPVYGTDGKRINTREFRYRKKLEDERHKLVQQAQKLDPQFVPPVDYQRPRKAIEKLYIPVRDYPDINFIGLIIGPRGNTLKKMESESKAKISIRGKGSVKEGKVPSASDGLEEDLHCLITADAPEKVAKAIKLIEKIIETAVSIPEAQNDLKRAQLRELASLNGTLRDDENQPCLNCGQVGHRRYECPEQRNFTANLVCRICGGAGHAARDCRDRNNPDAQQKNQKLDAEYYSLMAELGEQTEGGAGAGGNGANNSVSSLL